MLQLVLGVRAKVVVLGAPIRARSLAALIDGFEVGRVKQVRENGVRVTAVTQRTSTLDERFERS